MEGAITLSADAPINMHGMLAREFRKGTSSFALSKILFEHLSRFRDGKGRVG